MNIKTFFILAFSYFSISYAQALTKVKIATLEWPPYTCARCPEGGVASKVLKEYFKKLGYDVELSFYPWARAVKLTENDQVDALWPCWPNDVSGTKLRVGTPFFKSTFGFISRKSSNIELKKIEDLSNYRTGAVAGYGYDEDILQVLKSNPKKVQYVTDDKSNLKKLIGNRIDIALIDLINFEYSAKFLSPHEKDELIVQKNLQRNLDLALGFTDKNFDKYNEVLKKGLQQFDFEKRLAEELKKQMLAPQTKVEVTNTYLFAIKP